ncbi:MAG TPA: uroporphyrinogen decarboxylase [Vicinamibacterales bacterium]|nr:uroporphyrinogen decarboxylase [Vicinamibacterales bacterium]
MNDRFLRALRRETVDTTPVWFMRQAGRYMAEYRALRKRYTLLELCASPELAVAVTLQPLHAIEVDAAILFSDLLLPFTPMGLQFDFVHGEGPAVDNPIRAPDDVARLKPFEPREALGHVLETIRILRRELAGRVPLIGFGGAPFTLAAYAIEGGPSTSYALTKAFMYTHPQAWHRLCETFAAAMADYLRAQVEAGAQALQVFDSWAGALSRADYREFALPHTKRIFDALKTSGVPLIHFGVGTKAILADLAEAGPDVVGVDWRLPLDDAWALVGSGLGIQGNLDPTLLLGPRDRLLTAADDVLRRASGRPGHVFNLGHGVLPSTPVENVQALARHVHERGRTRQPDAEARS